MTFLDFEEPIQELYNLLEKAEKDSNLSKEEIKLQIISKRKEIYSSLNAWQKILVARHPERPYTLFYANTIFDSFEELHGDRLFKDDKAIIGGLAKLNNQTYMVIGHQKGINTKMRQYRNFGMANPEGFRKALRLMKMAEKFGFPVITLIDTPGAYPGIEAEDRGQAQAIANNLYEMAKLNVPILTYVIGEGASGGALGIGIADKIFMLQYAWFSVISPESCSSILWRTWEHKDKAAAALKLNAEDVYNFKLIDGILEEPVGGAHADPQEMAATLKKHIQEQIPFLLRQNPEERIEQRINKYASMGTYQNVE
jgi:acetyl-CoA carboxylase carboxyl transferase subunit alpha